MSALAEVLAFAAFSAWAPGSALQDSVTCAAAMEGSAGTVASVRQVPRQRDLHAFDQEALRHSVRPEEDEELVVRLDSGPLVVFTRREPHQLPVGQRVRVLLDRGVARVDRCVAPLASRGRSAQFS